MSSGKKIVIIGPAYPYRGGIASYSERLALQLRDEGNEVEIFTFTLQYPNFLFPGKTQYSEDIAPKDLQIERLINSVNPLNWKKVGKRIRKQQPDLLLFNYWLPFMGPCFGNIAREVKKNNHTKIVGIMHNVVPHEKRPGDVQFTKYFMKPVDAFISMAKSVSDDLAKFDSSKPRAFNPHPLYDNFGDGMSQEAAKTALGLDQNTKYILFFGIIRDYKGLDLLLDAFAKMNHQELNVKLLIAGEYYSDEEKYRKQIADLGISNDIKVVSEYIKDSDVGKYFCAADIVAQPYKSATQSGVTQIAYHFEIPMLVTNVGGLPEMVPDGIVGYVTSKDTDEIASALTDFFTSNKAIAFKENLKVEKEKYSWDKLTKTIMNIT
ncbi:glycosyltransferase family 4 protein [Paracrocinitomix mangrovi]|uniref:glycosyltransferase family 4 protein n=1 Tax=Paracrocinitomix mangrovi TaxID=2862509 RepID=UPI001C8E7523|nr:glycosyltransferase family 4 protein [Paracrocinitomix mangrovi]UKN01409.1 glycosyltransferase family 4 protein [Paracrocinitomix mangrovi]